MLFNLSSRLLNVLGACAVIVLMATAYYMEHVMGLEPCPLCMMQRFVLVAIGVVLIISALHNRWGKAYASTTLLLSIAGLAVAGRHVWIQHMPADKVPACAPSWDYMIDAFPLTEVLRTMLTGSGDCAEVDWTFLSLSIPQWMLIVFLGFIGLSLIQLLRKDNTHA